MDSDRLFDLDEIPRATVFRERRRAQAARGVALDARFANDYPPSWRTCQTCSGWGIPVEGNDYRVDTFTQSDLHRVVDVTHIPSGVSGSAVEGVLPVSGIKLRELALADLRRNLRLRDPSLLCPDCLGMGSLKARVRLEAGHRCERCRHPYVPKGDARMLGVEPTAPYDWSPCDDDCYHNGPVAATLADGSLLPLEHDLNGNGLSVATWRYRIAAGDLDGVPRALGVKVPPDARLLAAWRILTVHHLDGDKANCRWWNLAALCQRCHLEIQAKVVLERIYPHEHTPWFAPHAAGWYAFSYLGEELSREETLARLDELLELERTPA